MLKIYIVLDRDGNLSTNHGRATAYRTLGAAKRGAWNNGDSVVEFDLPVKEPLFIRRKVVKP